MIKINNILDVERYLDDTEVVLFDLDDTLYSEKEYVESGYQTIAKNYPNIPNFYNRLLLAFQNRQNAIDVVLEEEGLISEKEECLKIYRMHTPIINLYPNVKDMLLRISRNNKTGIITDGRPEGQHAKIKALGIEQLFDKIIITDELGGVEFRKPCEKAFVLMQQHFQVPFNKMVYIGDNVKKDFVAPQRLGMQCVYFHNKEGLYF